MKKLIAIAGVGLLSACALTMEQKQALADVAIAQIQALNEAGIDPLSLPEEQQAAISAGCAFIPAIYPIYAVEIAEACRVLTEAVK